MRDCPEFLKKIMSRGNTKSKQRIRIGIYSSKDIAYIIIFVNETLIPININVKSIKMVINEKGSQYDFKIILKE